MSVPDFQFLMLPLLSFASDRVEHSLVHARESIAATFHLSDADVHAKLPSGQSVLANRTAWAKIYLTRAGLLDSPKRGRFVITKRGVDVLHDPPTRIDIKFLQQFPEFLEFLRRGKDSEPTSADPEQSVVLETPDEGLERAYGRLRQGVVSELLARIKGASPQSFEQLVVELLLKMGYGGSRREAGAAIGRSGDEGIDGTISEDRLGLEMIYLQAKKWEGTVGRPEIQKFVGALHGKRARKGVFLTTGTFSTEAKQYVAHIDPKVVLIDGAQLTELMIDYGLGVTTVATYEIKKVDSDYFSDE
jgi:restriction system protein